MKPLIITKLYGGLGNQLFQYAVARNLSELNNVQLKLDITPFRKYKMRVYGLDHFNITAEVASKYEIRRLKKGNQLLRLSNHLRKNRIYPKTYYQEKSHFFDEELLNYRWSLYLDGYWQSEKYFKEIAAIIRKEFQLRDRPSEPSQIMAGLIENCDSVSLHIRRGDYVSNPEAYQHHGLCTLEYYYAAINRLASQLKAPHFFIFSDDIPWVRENLKVGFPTVYVYHNGEDKDYEDLWLMSLCKYHIIANSSFSWWGAWLADYRDKVVIAPEKWLNNSEINTNDLIPENWIKI
jgi:hypothetical protein